MHTQHLQGMARAGGVGAVAIVDDRDAGGSLLTHEARFGRLKVADTPGNFAQGHALMQGDGRSQQDVAHVMPAQQPGCKCFTLSAAAVKHREAQTVQALVDVGGDQARVIGKARLPALPHY